MILCKGPTCMHEDLGEDGGVFIARVNMHDEIQSPQ